MRERRLRRRGRSKVQDSGKGIRVKNILRKVRDNGEGLERYASLEALALCVARVVFARSVPLLRLKDLNEEL